uniref:U17-Austrotoxin-Ht1c_1 n=1 Tax=Hickmania troglodytes TaxID=489260 RepID=A0A482ZC75_9ARAC
MKVFMCLALLSALVIVTQASSDEIEQAGYLSADWDSFLNATSEIDWNAVKDEINDKLNNRNKCTGKGCGGSVLLQTTSSTKQAYYTPSWWTWWSWWS